MQICFNIEKKKKICYSKNDHIRLTNNNKKTNKR